MRNSGPTFGNFVLAFIALLFPPLGVGIKISFMPFLWEERPLAVYFVIGLVILLTILGWIPGVIYAWIMIFRNDENYGD